MNEPQPDNAPRSVAASTVNVMGIDLQVHVLSDGRRIFEADGMEQLLAAIEGGAVLTPEDAQAIARAARDG